jgi:hypothetical protein
MIRDLFCATCLPKDLESLEMLIQTALCDSSPVPASVEMRGIVDGVFLPVLSNIVVLVLILA